jgi:SepF-like predicted cell division protein (DUF552 family)
MTAFNRFKKMLSGDEETVQQEPDEYVEVDSLDMMEEAAAVQSASGKFAIRIDKLNEFADTDRVLRSLREGSIIFLKIKGLKEKDMGELKRAVEKLKKTVMANDGDIVGVEQDWLILTPESTTVHR